MEIYDWHVVCCWWHCWARHTQNYNISPDKNTAEQTGQQSRPKRKGSTMEDNMNAKRSEMYEAAINYMKQSSPVATAKLPPTDEDIFGQYVASQL